MIQLKRIDPHLAKSLIAELDAYLAELYPSESNHLDSVESLKAPNVHMVGAYESTELTAIGAVKLLADYAEIKRLFVPKRHRGKGLAKIVMGRVEQISIEHDKQFVRLETGIHQHEAIGLYRKLGYSECEAFGSYAEDPLSVFMCKQVMPNKGIQADGYGAADR